MNSLHLYIYSAVVMLLGGIVQGAVGFGFSLLMLPMISIYVPLKELIPISVLCSLPINLMVLWDARKSIKPKEIALMIICGIIFVPVGVYILKSADKNVLSAIIGFAIIVTSLSQIFGIKIRIKNEKAAFGIVGALSGIMNGSVSLSGPPIVLFFANQRESKNSTRGNFSLYAFITNIFVIISMTYSDVMHTSDFWKSISYYPFLIIGVFIGILISSRINEKLFRQLALGMLCCIGLWTISKALFVFLKF